MGPSALHPEELPGAGLQVLPEKELRNLVRRALRSARRDCRQFLFCEELATKDDGADLPSIRDVV